jgi:hypothetical protein
VGRRHSNGTDKKRSETYCDPGVRSEVDRAIVVTLPSLQGSCPHDHSPDIMKVRLSSWPMSLPNPRLEKAKQQWPCEETPMKH